MGMPLLVEPSTTEETERVMFLSDIHAPFHDEDAIDAVLRFIPEFDPHRIVLNGDIQDFYSLSRFDRDYERNETLDEEIGVGNRIRSQIRHAAPNAVIDETEGNHEARLEAYLRRNVDTLAPILSLPKVKEAMSIKSLFNYDLLEINGYGSEGFFLRENFRVKHGEFARQDAGMSAKAQMLRGFTNGVSGHTHRLSRFSFRADGGRMYEWFEGGCLCSMDAEYIRGGVPNWEQGFTVGQFSTTGSLYLMDEVRIQDGKIRWQGQVI
jgi:hypothetical protein